MRNIKILLAIVVLVMLSLSIALRDKSNPSAPDTLTPQSQQSVRASTGVLSSETTASAPHSSESVSVMPNPINIANPTKSHPKVTQQWDRNPPELGLTLVLSGDQLVAVEGREYRVLGTKTHQSPDGNAQPVLLLRDEASGQIDYFQSGLQFRLQPGASYPAFIRERIYMKTQFSNSDYADVLVEAGRIAAEYRNLKTDPRVTYVAFLTPQRMSKTK